MLLSAWQHVRLVQIRRKVAAFLFLSAGGCIPSKGSYNLLLQEWLPVPPTAALIFLVFHPTLSKKEVCKARNGILCRSQWNRWSWWMMGNFNGQFVDSWLLQQTVGTNFVAVDVNLAQSFAGNLWGETFPSHPFTTDLEGYFLLWLASIMVAWNKLMVSREKDGEWNSSQRLLEILHCF